MNVHIQPATETPAQQVERLTAELSTALDGYCRGQFRAVVEPEGTSSFPVLLQAMRRPAPKDPEGDDPLVAAIAAYRDGEARYGAADNADIEADEEKVIAETYGPPLDVLLAWDRPAVTAAGALAALRLAKEEADRNMAGELIRNMVTAALGYFEGAATKLRPLGDAGLRSLMTEWTDAYNVTNEGDINTAPDFTDLEATEAKIEAVAPTTAVGFAIKLLALTSYGGFAMDGTADSLLDDAKRILAQAGIAPPSTMGPEQNLEGQHPAQDRLARDADAGTRMHPREAA